MSIDDCDKSEAIGEVGIVIGFSLEAVKLEGKRELEVEVRGELGGEVAMEDEEDVNISDPVTLSEGDNVEMVS